MQKPRTIHQSCIAPDTKYAHTNQPQVVLGMPQQWDAMQPILIQQNKWHGTLTLSHSTGLLACVLLPSSNIVQYRLIHIVQGVPQHRSHFQISITFSNLNVLAKFMRQNTKKEWESFIILMKKKCCKKAVSSLGSSAFV